MLFVTKKANKNFALILKMRGNVGYYWDKNQFRRFLEANATLA